MKRLIFTIIIFLSVLEAGAQHADYSKMSSLVRQLTMSANVSRRQALSVNGRRPAHLCAFIRIQGDADEIFADNECRQLAHFGDIYIADIPINSLKTLSLDGRVKRIEASRGNSVLMDSTAMHINALPAYSGSGLPQAYTGKGVVVGIQDIGFDLTHPNFYDSSVTDYRIKRLWDQLSTDTIGSHLYVGNDYSSQDSLLKYAYSRDGETQTHGTHTLGIAAGSGYNSRYRGMAYESDMCLVANATSNNAALIDSADYYKYTYATDALGFKYMFDYAKSVGKPCVISFSEGSTQDFRGDDVLYYAMLDSLVGPGRIIVSSAGNAGWYKTYFHKPSGVESMGSFLSSWSKGFYCTLKSDGDFDMRFVVYDSDKSDTLMIPTQRILEKADSEFVDTFKVGSKQYIFDIVGYHSCYNTKQMVYDVQIIAEEHVGASLPVSMELIGINSDVEYYCVSGFLVTNDKNSSLNAGENTHSINSPSSAPNVICVGATSYRTGFTNYAGVYHSYNQGTNGQRGDYSSVGPTYDGRIKPDVMAPGTNIISSYSSYYLEHNPNASDIQSDVELFQFNGRTYPWTSDAGTSMSSPAAAGGIAIWLQANPRLTPDDVKAIFSRTCSHYDSSITYPNNYYGYGQIDVYRGLLDILGLDGIRGISPSQPSSVKICPLSNGDVRMDFNEMPVNSFSVCVYSTSGKLVLKNIFAPLSVSYTMPLGSLPHGVYVVQVNGDKKGMTGSTLIRR